MWATSFFRDGLSTHATKQVRRLMHYVLPNGKYPIRHKQGVTYIYRCSKCKNEVKHHAHTCQRCQIREVITQVGLSPNFVYHSYPHNEQGPNGCYEQRHNKWQFCIKRIKRGMVIKFNPCARNKTLYAAIKCSRATYTQTKQEKAWISTNI